MYLLRCYCIKASIKTSKISEPQSGPFFKNLHECSYKSLISISRFHQNNFSKHERDLHFIFTFRELITHTQAVS